MELEYCVVVGAQHNYTDDYKVAKEWFVEELKNWLKSNKKYLRPELVARVEGSTNWFTVA